MGNAYGALHAPRRKGETGGRPTRLTGIPEYMARWGRRFISPLDIYEVLTDLNRKKEPNGDHGSRETGQ